MGHNLTFAFTSKVYLDATIPSYYFDQRESLATFAEITRQWWSEMAGEYELFVSDAVLNELKAGDYPNKKEVVALVSGISPLPRLDDLDRIVKFYVANYVMPESLTVTARVISGVASHIQVEETEALHVSRIALMVRGYLRSECVKELLSQAQDSSLTHSTLQLRATMSAIRHPCLIMGQCPSNFEGRNRQVIERGSISYLSESVLYFNSTSGRKNTGEISSGRSDLTK